MLARVQDSPWLSLVNFIGSPSLLLYMSGFTLLIGGVALLAGYRARLAGLSIL